MATAIVEFVYDTLAENPHRVGHKLELEFEGLTSARRGPYRVIYEVDEDRRLATIVNVGHRSDVYRSR